MCHETQHPASTEIDNLVTTESRVSSAITHVIQNLLNWETDLLTTVFGEVDDL